MNKIEYYGDPMYVENLKDEKNMIFIGNYYGFKNCERLENCIVMSRKNKKPWFLYCTDLVGCMVRTMTLFEKIKFILKGWWHGWI